MSAIIRKVKVGRTQLSYCPEEKIAELLAQHILCKGQTIAREVIFLTFGSFLWSFVSAAKRQQLNRAFLVYPFSPLLGWAFRQLVPEYRSCHFLQPFHLIVRFLIALNNRQGTLFILGDSQQNIAHAEEALQRSFPQVRILGRCHSVTKKESCNSVLVLVRKCESDLLLLGRGKFSHSYSQEVSQKVGLIFHYPKIVKRFAQYRSIRRNRRKQSYQYFSFWHLLSPWIWLRIPFSIIFVLYVLISKSRKNYG